MFRRISSGGCTVHIVKVSGPLIQITPRSYGKIKECAERWIKLNSMETEHGYATSVLNMDISEVKRHVSEAVLPEIL